MIIEIASLIGLTVVAIIVLYSFARFRDWVKVRIGGARNKHLVAGLARERLEDGDYKVIQFLFNEEVNKIVEAEAVQAQLFEEDLEQKFKNDIYISA